MPTRLNSFSFLLSVLLCICFFKAEAAFFSSVKRFSVEDGLPATTIYSMLKDNRGYFWLGTPSGLVRFDGYDFEVYSPHNTHNKTIEVANAGNIFQDSQNRIWIGSWGKGVLIYDQNLNLIAHYQEDLSDPNALQSNMVQVFFEDSDGNIWLGSNGGGLAKYDDATKQFTNFKNTPDDSKSISHNRVWSIAQDSKGNIWAGTSNGLNLLTDQNVGTFERFMSIENEPTSIDHPIVRALYIDQSDRIWIGTELSFGEFRKATGHYKPKNPQGANINAAITRIRQGKEKEIWVGTQKGLYRYQPKDDQFTALINATKYALMPHDDIRDIYVDQEESIWVATRYAGLSRIEFTPSRFQKYQYYSEQSGLQSPIKMVYSMLQDSVGNVWIGTSEGLLLWTPEATRKISFDNLPSDADVFALEEDDKGNLWLGMDSGLGMLPLDRRSFVIRNDILKGYENLAVTNLYFNSRNYLWIATNHAGAVRYKQDDVSYFKHNINDPDSISGNSIGEIFEDDKGRMWVSSQGNGVNRLDPGRTKFFHYSAGGDESLKSSSINDIQQTSDGTMWFAGEQSLDKLDDVTDTFENITRGGGLENANIRAIVEDDFGDLWLSTDYGLTQYRRKQKFFVTYRSEDGLHNNHFFQRSRLKSDKYGIFFGGNNGFTRITSVVSNLSSQLPNPAITGVWVDGKKLPRFSFNDGSPLKLPHTVKNIEIHFSALAYTDTENNQYRHRLVNFNDQWSDNSRENKVSFSGLDSGVYTFELRASNSFNVWSSRPNQLIIDIKTPWWRLWWLRILALLLVVSTIYGWYKHRTQALASQKRLLEEQVNLRTEDLVNAHKQLIESEKNASLSGLVAGVAHEINTPVGISVTAASNLIERCKLLQRSFDQGTLKKSEFAGHVDNIFQSADMVLSNLTRAADLIRSFKEVSVDQISQQRRTFNFRHYLDEIMASLNPRLRRENVSVEIDCDADIQIDSYPGAIAQLITNLAINAVLHAFEEQDGGIIKIHVRKSGDMINLNFSDNGRGIPASDLDKIFEPFYTTKRGKGGSGLGLQIISNIVNIRLGGTIKCESELGKGTTFHMQFLATPA
ncbi:MAG: hypothetical protein GJ680_20865 [Alteromonadaceae bacterium]|nr:hypothetical protein [Alteromonadaceae bacterium]